MSPPQVSNPATMATRNIRFNVLAYRKLTDDEIRLAIRQFCSTEEARKLKSNGTYDVVTEIGSEDVL